MTVIRRLAQISTAVALMAVLGLSACSKEKPTGVIEARAKGESRPNILLIVVDHLGPELGAYGDKAARTPNIDRLAREGVTFTNAYAVSGAEDAATLGMLTGAHPSTVGMVQEWTDKPGWAVRPPPEVRAFPEVLRAAGYHTFHIGTRPDAFGSPSSLWVEDVSVPGSDWVTGSVGQPFLGVIELSTLEIPRAAPKARSLWDKMQFWKKPPKAKASPIDARAIRAPGYLPDTPEVRAALKAEYERVNAADAKVGEILARLERTGVLVNTVVVFAAKSGPARPRAERTVYDSGARAPLIVRWPDGRGKGTVRRDLVSGVDLAPSVLKLGGVQPLAWMQGKDRFTQPGELQRFVFTVQNRVDQVYERAFAVRDGRWLFVLNLAYETPMSSLTRPGPLADAVTAARKGGKLTQAQARLFAPDRPEAELYDLNADPWQLNNLAGDKRHSAEIARLTEALNRFAASAPDYSVWSAQELGDLFRPGGQTPMAMQPTGAVRGGKLVLETITPGASILWRMKAEDAWRLYVAPVPLAGQVSLEAKAVRYGFRESPTADLKFKG